MNSPIVILTNTYPYDKGEIYLKEELNIAAKFSNDIYLLPNDNSHSSINDLPKNVHLFQYEYHYSRNDLSYLDYIIALISILKEIPKLYLKKQLDLKNLKYYFSLFLRFIHRARFNHMMVKQSISNKKIILYSYWSSDTLTIASIMSKLYSNYRVVCRAHGFDLFEDQMKFGYMPFRNLQFKQCSNIFSISKSGSEYLKEKYPKYSNKIKYSYLGVQENGTNPFNKEENLKIVSCAIIRDVKGIDRIIEVLKNLEINVFWTHIGDGPLYNDIKNLTNQLPENISFKLKGYLNHNEVIKFYSNEPIDLFLNLSRSEGVPVSIMEAISFSIPVVSTDVGGCSEIVNEETGYLVSSEFDYTEVVKIINMYNRVSQEDRIIKREKVKLFWKSEFNAKKNYSYFIEQINKM